MTDKQSLGVTETDVRETDRQRQADRYQSVPDLRTNVIKSVPLCVVKNGQGIASMMSDTETASPITHSQRAEMN